MSVVLLCCLFEIIVPILAPNLSNYVPTEIAVSTQIFFLNCVFVHWRELLIILSEFISLSDDIPVYYKICRYCYLIFMEIG